MLALFSHLQKRNTNIDAFACSAFTKQGAHSPVNMEASLLLKIKLNHIIQPKFLSFYSGSSECMCAGDRIWHAACPIHTVFVPFVLSLYTYLSLIVDHWSGNILLHSDASVQWMNENSGLMSRIAISILLFRNDRGDHKTSFCYQAESLILQFCICTSSMQRLREQQICFRANICYCNQ